MICENPIQLKSGLVVPCGKCVLCLSKRRDEWSARLQLHTMSYDSMPFFVTLTYRPEEVVTGDSGYTLVPDHVRRFIKRIKDKYDLYNSDFAYFGCGEYGDKGDPALDRPHYHLILFGFPQLEEAYQRGVVAANKLLSDNWVRIDSHTGIRYPLGFVDVGRAEWSGIHYVTKYVLKFIDEDYIGKQKPFVLFTRGIGKNWFKSAECSYIKRRLEEFVDRYKFIDPGVELDYSSPTALRDSAYDCMQELSSVVPKLVVTLPQGNRIAMPRYYRKKLIGSFEHFMDNPFWIYNLYSQLHEAASYLVDHGDYDRESDQTYFSQIVEFAKNRINQRLILKQSCKRK